MYRINSSGAGHDIERIMAILLNHGIVATPEEAEALWQKHSDSMAAGWLFLPEYDADLWRDLESQLPESLKP